MAFLSIVYSGPWNVTNLNRVYYRDPESLRQKQAIKGDCGSAALREPLW